MEKLALFFMMRMCNRVNKPLKGIQSKALQILKGHNWPGNIRELKGCIGFAVQVADSDILCAEHLPEYLTSGVGDACDRSVSPSEVINAAERELIGRALLECDGRVGNAAASLGMSGSTLYRKCKKLGLTG